MNEQLANEISEKNVDIDKYINLILKDENIRDDIVDLTLHHPHIMVYYHGYYILDKATELEPSIFYKYWDEFESLLKHKNTYHRQIGIVILSNLSDVDMNNNFSKIMKDYLNCLYDNKILIGTYCVKYLKNIIRNKPEYKNQVMDELLNHRKKTHYNKKQEALLEFYILELFEENYQELENKDKINSYITERQISISPKTKKKSKELIKKFEINQ